jgi:hypothetical protein
MLTFEREFDNLQLHLGDYWQSLLSAFSYLSE